VTHHLPGDSEVNVSLPVVKICFKDNGNKKKSELVYGKIQLFASY